MFSGSGTLAGRTSVAPVSDINETVPCSYGTKLHEGRWAVNKTQEDGDRRDAYPTRLATPTARRPARLSNRPAAGAEKINADF